MARSQLRNDRPREIGRTWLLKQIGKTARFKKLKDFCRVYQNGLAFLGWIGKLSLSEFTEIYDGLLKLVKHLYCFLRHCASTFPPWILACTWCDSHTNLNWETKLTKSPWRRSDSSREWKKIGFISDEDPQVKKDRWRLLRNYINSKLPYNNNPNCFS